MHPIVLAFLGGESLETLEHLRICYVLGSRRHRSNQVRLQMWEQQRGGDHGVARGHALERQLRIALDEDWVDLVGKLEWHLPDSDRVHHGQTSAGRQIIALVAQWPYAY
jgi:hypothetical protein